MTEFWDQRYDSSEYVYGEEPNRYFADRITRLFSEGSSPSDHSEADKAFRLLLPMEGEGRNAVYAAKQGWIVDAFDQSKVAQKKASGLAAASGVAVNYDIRDVTSADLPDDRYDAAGLIYAHIPPQYRQMVHRQIINTLRPGGLVIIEAFHVSQLGKASGGPQCADMLYTADILKSDFQDCYVQELDETETVLEEGPGHSGPASIVRAVFRKRT